MHKITKHTIIEHTAVPGHKMTEHLIEEIPTHYGPATPLVPQVATHHQTFDGYQCPPPMASYYSIISPMHMETTAQFMTTIHSIFERYLWDMRQYLLSILNNTKDQKYISSKLEKDATEIATTGSAHLNKGAKTALSTFLTASIKTLHDEAMALKSGESIADIQAAYDKDIVAFATAVNSLNPTAWPKDAVASIFTKLDESWVSQIQARLANDWASDEAAVVEAKQILSTGQINGTPGFAHIFATGIITQSPKDFAKA
jgi:hypothetical protein